MQGPGPIIKCNRKPKKEYKYFFRETFCGSENLTRACIERLGKKKVEEGLDILKGEHHDMLDKRVYDREKVRIKDRECYLEHFSPNCRTCSKASRNPRRWKDEPYGRVQDEDLMNDSKLMVRARKLAQMRHCLGEAFSIEHIYPTPMIEMDC